MSCNLNSPALLPGKLSAADFQATVPYAPAALHPRVQPLQLPAHLRGPRHPIDPQPGALHAETSCDVDDDGGCWHPAPVSTLLAPLGLTAAVAMLVALIVFADEVRAGLSLGLQWALP